MPESLRPLIRGVAVLRRVGDLREISDRGDAGVERAQRADQIADIGILGPVVIGGGAGNVAEIVGEQPVRQNVAQRALVTVMVRIDEPRQHDHVGGIDHGRLRADVGPYRDNPAAFDQHIGLVEIADAAVEAQDHAALDERAGWASLCESGHPAGGAGSKRRCSRCHETAAAGLRLRARVILHGDVLPSVLLIGQACRNLSASARGGPGGLSCLLSTRALLLSSPRLLAVVPAIFLSVVPAKPGTHTPCAGDVARLVKSRKLGGYWSPLSRGRH
jgi:hypothetical protein